MAQPKKRKSDVYNCDYGTDNVDHPNTKKEKHWFEENDSNNAENRRSSTSIFKGFLKKMKSSTTLKHTNKAMSSSKIEPIAANETQVSLDSDSNVSSSDTTNDPIVSIVGRNAGLRTFVNAECLTPVPPSVEQAVKEDPVIAEDSLSVSSHMSIDTISSNRGVDDEEMLTSSASVFCTPSRNTLHRNGLRMSTRSVPETDPSKVLFNSLCNSVNRQPIPPSRRSLRFPAHKRSITAMSMEDVPEEEALVVSSSSVIRTDSVIEEEEPKEEPTDQSIDEGNGSFSRLSTISDEPRVSCGGSSIGRRNSIFKMFSSKSSSKDRRMSEVLPSDYHPDTSSTRERRSSIVSFSNECTFGSHLSESHSSLVSTDTLNQPKMRKKVPSTTNLTQRLSSVFRRNSSSAFKDDDSQSSRRNTLTGYSSISSGIGSIASGISDAGYGTLSQRTGQSISRNGSKRDDESRRERSRRLLERIVISDIPADELLKLKLEQIRRQKQQHELNEQLETHLNDSGSSNQSLQNEVLNFDFIALDLKNDGSPFSAVSSAFMDQSVCQKVRDEMKTNFRPDLCGSVTDCEPKMVFVCPEQPQCTTRNPNDSFASTADPNSDLLRNVRSAICKSLEEWKKISVDRDESTMLIYPMFCSSEADWDSTATIDAIFFMLDGILQNPKRWRKNGKCLLAGITENNVRLLREKYEKVKQSVTGVDECDGVFHQADNLDVVSMTSSTTVFETALP